MSCAALVLADPGLLASQSALDASLWWAVRTLRLDELVVDHLVAEEGRLARHDRLCDHILVGLPAVVPLVAPGRGYHRDAPRKIKRDLQVYVRQVLHRVRISQDLLGEGVQHAVELVLLLHLPILLND